MNPSQVAQFLLSPPPQPICLPQELLLNCSIAEVRGFYAAGNYDVNACDSQKRTAMHLAASSGRMDLIKLLLSRGAKIEPLGENQMTPLHLASMMRHYEVVKFLLDNGANINLHTIHQGQHGQSYVANALVHAGLRENNEKIFDLLLERGADLNIAIEVCASSSAPSELRVLVNKARLKIQQEKELNEKKEKNKQKKEAKLAVKQAKTAIQTIEDTLHKFEDDAKRQEEARAYALQVEQQRAEREAQERQHLEERKLAKKQEEKREQLVRTSVMQVYNTLSEFTSAQGKVKVLFKGGSDLRKMILDKIFSSGKNYFIDATDVVDQKLLCKDILIKLGLEKGSALYLDLIKQFDEMIDNGEEGIQLRQAAAAAEAARLAQEAATKSDEVNAVDKLKNEERMDLNKKIYDQEKARNTASSSSSSSSTRPASRIGFTNKEDADKVRALVEELIHLANQYQSPQNISGELLELKHDFIKISAVIKQIVDCGGRLIVNALLDPTQVDILRNGALHLLEVTSTEPKQIQFYQNALLQLGLISTLNIDQDKIKKGLNFVLNHIETASNFPLNLKPSNNEMYAIFEANYIAWQNDHAVNKRSDVSLEIETRLALLGRPTEVLSKRETMLIVEIAELYQQVRNTGSNIPRPMLNLIELKNKFTHEGKPIEAEQIQAILKPIANLASLA